MSAAGSQGHRPPRAIEASRLPYVDEHSTVVAARAEHAWAALLAVVERSFSFAGAGAIARLLGCEDVEPAGPRPPAEGSSCPGFHVEAAEQPSELALLGRHRFSRYALTFRLEDLGADGTRLRAETRAEFLGVKGRLYRALVIGTRGHVLATRGILRAARARAEAVDG